MTPCELYAAALQTCYDGICDAGTDARCGSLSALSGPREPHGSRPGGVQTSPIRSAARREARSGMCR